MALLHLQAIRGRERERPDGFRSGHWMRHLWPECRVAGNVLFEPFQSYNLITAWQCTPHRPLVLTELPSLTLFFSGFVNGVY